MFHDSKIIDAVAEIVEYFCKAFTHFHWRLSIDIYCSAVK